jgi:diacylglycerol kinase family enzyme
MSEPAEIKTPTLPEAALPEKFDAAEKIDVIINRRAGTVLHLGEEAVRKGLEESLGDRLGELRFIDGSEITSSVKQWVADHGGQKRGLILGGGDGSVLTAAAEFLNRDDLTLGVLPLGTHNLFARQLGFSADFKAAAAQYKNLRTDKVDVGNVNGMNFLVGLEIDQNSVGFYASRELFRDKTFKNLIKAAGKFLSTMFGIAAGRKTTLDVSGTEHKGRVFLVTNNEYKPRSNEGQVLLPTAKRLKPIIENILAKSEADGQLAFYSFRGGAHRFAALLTKLWNGTWTKAKSIKVQTAPELIIKPKAAKDQNAALPIILDGEVKTTNYPLNTKILARALKVYRPALQ